MSDHAGDVPVSHAVGKYLPSLPAWDVVKAVQLLVVMFLTWNLVLAASMVLGCVVFTFGFLFGLVPDRYEIIP